MKTNGHACKSSKAPAFVERAKRAHRRVASNIRAESRSRGFPVIVWKNGKIVKEAA